MARACNANPTIAGIKGAAYAVLADGTTRRVTRSALLAGNFPDGTNAVRVGHPRNPIDFPVESARASCGASAVAARAFSREVKNANSTYTTADGVEYEVAAPIFTIDGNDFLFGVPDDVRFSDLESDVVRVPRNPYRACGLDPKSQEGRDLAAKYTAAVSAVCAARACTACGSSFSCPSCLQDGDGELRRAVRSFVGAGCIDQPVKDPTLVVDALLYASGLGNRQATAELETLAAVGEHLIAAARRRRNPDIPPDEALEVLGFDNQEFHSWVDVKSDELIAPLERREQELRKQQDALLRENTGDSANELGLISDEIYEVGKQMMRRRDLLRDITNARLFYKSAGLDELYLVHETIHEPSRTEDGVELRPVRDYDDYYNRQTIHLSIGHVVQGHMYRPSVQGGYAVIVSLKDALEANPGCLDNLYVVDTYFTPRPGEPLHLPGAKVVRYEDFPPKQDLHHVVEETLRANDVRSELTSAQLAELTGIVSDSVLRVGSLTSLTEESGLPPYLAEKSYEEISAIENSIVKALNSFHQEVAQQRNDVVGQHITQAGGRRISGGMHVSESTGADEFVRILAANLGATSRPAIDGPQALLEKQRRDAAVSEDGRNIDPLFCYRPSTLSQMSDAGRQRLADSSPAGFTFQRVDDGSDLI